jgi:hypothetical protein
MRVISMTPEEINQLPPGERTGIVQLVRILRPIHDYDVDLQHLFQRATLGLQH